MNDEQCARPTTIVAADYEYHPPHVPAMGEVPQSRGAGTTDRAAATAGAAVQATFARSSRTASRRCLRNVLGSGEMRPLMSHGCEPTGATPAESRDRRARTDQAPLRHSALPARLRQSTSTARGPPASRRRSIANLRSPPQPHVGLVTPFGFAGPQSALRLSFHSMRGRSPTSAKGTIPISSSI